MNRAKDIEEIIKGFKLIRQRLRPSAGATSKVSFSHSQWLVLAFVGRHELVTVGSLSKALGISSSAATQLVNNLEKKGFVERATHPGDARVSVLKLTPRTKKTFTSIRKKKLKEFGQLFEVFNDAEFAHYLKLHTKLTESISHTHEPEVG